MPKSTNIPSPPSELFKDAIRCAGSLVISCELCGRVHFGSYGGFEEGELEGLLAKQKIDPDKYIQHCDDDMVSYGYIQGKQAVLDCKCNELGRFESWIQSHKFIIMDYLSRYAQEQFDKADNLHKVYFDTQQLMAGLKRNERENGKTRVFDLD